MEDKGRRREVVDERAMTVAQRDATAEPGTTDKPVAARSTFLPDDQMRQVRTRWREIARQFETDPQGALQQAEILLAEVVDELSIAPASEPAASQGRWEKYAAFFDCILGQA
jgi:hypothetical protein